MDTTDMKLERVETSSAKLACGFTCTTFLLLVLVLLLVVGFVDSSLAEDARPKTFTSAGEAAAALFEATKRDNEQAVEAILGAGKDVTSSGDEAQDKLEHEQFSQKYEQMHRLVQEPDGTTVLYIGAENWPFPIPLMSKNGAWYFDTATGKQEILFRRIGENEATAIAVCEEFAIAKNDERAKAGSKDPITQFAENLFSASQAAGNTDPVLFHGYYFRLVTNSGTDVRSSDMKPRSVKLVAYPAEYKSSGVMTFVVTGRGLVFENDLGRDTQTVAPGMKAWAGSSWRPAESI